MWKAEVVKRVIIRGLLTVGVKFTNTQTGESFRENYTSKGQGLDIVALAKQRVSEIENLKTLEASIADGEIDLKPKPTPTPTPAPTPSQAEIDEANDRETFSNLMSKLEKLKRLVDLGIFTEQEAKLPAIRTQLKALATKLKEV